MLRRFQLASLVPSTSLFIGVAEGSRGAGGWPTWLGWAQHPPCTQCWASGLKLVIKHHFSVGCWSNPWVPCLLFGWCLERRWRKASVNKLQPLRRCSWPFGTCASWLWEGFRVAQPRFHILPFFEVLIAARFPTALYIQKPTPPHPCSKQCLLSVFIFSCSNYLFIFT